MSEFQPGQILFSEWAGCWGVFLNEKEWVCFKRKDSSRAIHKTQRDGPAHIAIEYKGLLNSETAITPEDVVISDGPDPKNEPFAAFVVRTVSEALICSHKTKTM